MKYYIYRTYFLPTGEEYTGKTNSVRWEKEGYHGSGEDLIPLLKLHGKEKFKREILHVFDDEDEAYAKERELVTLEYCKLPYVLNQRPGGKGFSAGEKHPMFGSTGKDCPNFGRTGKKHPMYGKKHKTDKCPHCLKVVPINMINLHHNDNCTIKEAEEIFNKLLAGATVKELEIEYGYFYHTICSRIKEYEDYLKRIGKEVPNILKILKDRRDKLAKEIYEKKEAGVHVNQLAEENKCSVSTIYKLINHHKDYLKRIGKEFQKIDRDKLAKEIYEKKEAGATIKELMKEYDKTKTTIYNLYNYHLKKIGINPKILKDKLAEEIYDKKEAGVHVNQLMKEYDKSMSTIYMLYNRHKKTLKESE